MVRNITDMFLLGDEVKVIASNANKKTSPKVGSRGYISYIEPFSELVESILRSTLKKEAPIKDYVVILSPKVRVIFYTYGNRPHIRNEEKSIRVILPTNIIRRKGKVFDYYVAHNMNKDSIATSVLKHINNKAFYPREYKALLIPTDNNILTMHTAPQWIKSILPQILYDNYEQELAEKLKMTICRLCTCEAVYSTVNMLLGCNHLNMKAVIEHAFTERRSTIQAAVVVLKELIPFFNRESILYRKQQFAVENIERRAIKYGVTTAWQFSLLKKLSEYAKLYDTLFFRNTLSEYERNNEKGESIEFLKILLEAINTIKISK